MPVPNYPLRQSQTEAILAILAGGECCALYGLSNIGKSPFLRSFPTAEVRARYQHLAGRPGALIYIDCNRVVELTAPGFYEIVLRSLIETLEEDAAQIPNGLLGSLHDYHARITTAPSTFQASLAFNNAISETCAQLGRNLILLFDEFDEVYTALEDRALLNLRALRDKFQTRLVYLTATVRALNESRGNGDNEFGELFTAQTLALGLFEAADAQAAIRLHGGEQLSVEVVSEILRLAGGHYGLLSALTQAALRRADPARLAGDASARAECQKIWNQLRPDERAALESLITDAQAGLNPHDHEHLQALGLITPHGELFSPLFTGFVRRQSAVPAPETVGIVVDEDAGEVWVDGVKVSVLTDLEYRLMRLLHQRPDRLTTKDMIVEAVWGGQYFDKVDDARIEKLVSRLRAKIETDPAQPRYLLTQRGRGYKLSSRPVEGKASNDDEAQAQ